MSIAKSGIGASVPRKEDDRFLRGRGQYVGDIRMAGTREVAFVRSPVAHARIKEINIPEQFRDVVFTAEHLSRVRPIISAPPLKGFKYSVEPILAADKVRYVGEMVAMCMGSTRAEAEVVEARLVLREEPADRRVRSGRLRQLDDRVARVELQDLHALVGHGGAPYGSAGIE